MERWLKEGRPYLIYTFFFILIISTIKHGFEIILFQEYRFSILLISINVFTLGLFSIILTFFVVKLNPEINTEQTSKILVPVMVLTILFPILDKFITSLSISSFTRHELYDPFCIFSNHSISLPAIFLALAVSIFFSAGVLRLKKDKVMISFVLASMAGLFAFLISTTPYIFTELLRDVSFLTFENTRELHLIFLCILIIVNFLVMTLTYHRSNKSEFLSLIKNLKLFRTVHFVVMVIIGIVVVREIAPANALDVFSIQYFPYIFLPALCMALTWQFTAMINDYYDIDIDKFVHPDRPLITGKISSDRFLQLAVIAGGISAFLSLLIGILPFILNLTFIIAALLYSIPPIRLKNRIFGYVCVGWASVVAFLTGIYSPVAWRSELHWFSTTTPRNIPFFPDIAVISLILFSVLSISPYINAIADYEGDKEGGVKSIYTIYGLEKGKKIVSILIMFLFLSPLLLFNSTIDILILLSASLASVLIFYFIEKYQAIFGIYFSVLIYVLARFLGMISF